MTTESSRTTTRQRVAAPRAGTVLGVVVTAAVGALVALAGLLLDGGAAALAGLAGTGVTLVVLVGGYLVVERVARTAPIASLVAAVATFGVQVAVLAALLAVVRSDAAIARDLDVAWFAAGVVGAALAWTTAMVIAHHRTRVPVYDLPADSVLAPVPGRTGRASQPSEASPR